MWPCVIILTPDRQKKTYKKMLKELKEASTSPLQTQRVLSDFERSAMNAYEEEFPGIKIKGCHFHMTQSLWRKVQELGMATEYMVRSF